MSAVFSGMITAAASPTQALPAETPCDGMPVPQFNSVTSGEVEHATLMKLGFPEGLANVGAHDFDRISLRIYLLDNSGSTQGSDGNVLKDAGNRQKKLKQCTRWEEICEFALEHAQYNLTLGTPCEFVLLNPRRPAGTPSREGRDYVRVDKALGQESSQLSSLRRLLQENSPRGVTPITERLEEIRCRIQRDLPKLTADGGTVFMTIATDGLPTSSFFGVSFSADQREMAAKLQVICRTLPVHVVIRLCTDDCDTIDFYNHVVDDDGLHLKVIDDMSNEAEEIAMHSNDWFAYTPVLQRLREAGTFCKLLDAIDERPLNANEVRELAVCLAGESCKTQLEQLSDRAFINEMDKLVATAPLVYDAYRQSMQPIINMRRLRMAMKVGIRGRLFPVLCLGL